ncbi:hypothetical protein [Vibrio quintilis]|uniref:Bacteriophage CI repressor helix-turn-helix domain protein n=1 Tax=Vibrio quintilis TaxID=1117707 RepID=A0A1M7Z1H6_9VIBR|nr:hypothetical protein [Vibrio quintilis]SHO58695.1 Bacteriophage CI repressor helix-turn-helix domain protein [Vibrio quintilis]
MEKHEENPLLSQYKLQIDQFKDRLRDVMGDESVRSFSKRCGISESVIRKYLKGSYPVMDKLPRIAEATGMSMGWLISGCESDCIAEASGQNQELPERLKILMKGREARQAAEDWQVSVSTLKACLDGSVPSLNIASRIASAEGISLEWLATGHGLMYQTDDGILPPKVQGINRETLTQSIEKIDSLCQKNALILDNRKKARIIALVYQMSLNPEKIDESVYFEIIKLAS